MPRPAPDTKAPRIAVLMTCFNRRALTVAALERLARQDLFREDDLYLVDDGSSDGTGDAVRAMMPGANVIEGDGSLFWNGGMRLAWDTAKAATTDYDYYLWLNDDVALSDTAMAEIIADARGCAGDVGPVIVAAATSAPDDPANIVYSAQSRPNPAKPLRLKLIKPSGTPVRADTVSGNIVLVSDAAERILGNIRPDFEHIFGDLDYGFRAKAAGVPVWLASRVGGTCDANSPTGSSLDQSLPRLTRLRLRWAEERKVHARDWRRFVALHGKGPADRIKHALAPYLRIIAGKPHRHIHASGPAAKT